MPLLCNNQGNKITVIEEACDLPDHLTGNLDLTKERLMFKFTIPYGIANIGRCRLRYMEAV